MAEAPAEMLRVADQHWTDGLLAPAHAGYAQALQLDPGSWHAAFQLAWIDASFGPLDPARVRELTRPDLPVEARAVLKVLVAPRPTLAGEVADWDLVALRARPEASKVGWWTDKATKSGHAGQYGVSLACWHEAEHLAPDRFFDPPSEMQAAAQQIENHLRAVRSVRASSRAKPAG